jgi:DNA invertase Pin-like site-specific DNA recombinase
MKKYVSYKRVSTAEQVQSGLGIEAQDRSIKGYVNDQEGTIIKEFSDLGVSGSKNDREGLNAAVKYARKTKSSLVVQKLDRLSRDMAFIVNFLKDAPFDVICSDSPNDDMFILNIKASVAQAERETISKRTIAGLQSAKLRGAVLGRRPGAEGNYYKLSDEDMIKSAEVKRSKAVARWIDWLDEIKEAHELVCSGATWQQAADLVNSMGMTSENNKPILKASLHRIIKMFKKEGILS